MLRWGRSRLSPPPGPHSQTQAMGLKFGSREGSPSRGDPGEGCPWGPAPHTTTCKPRLLPLPSSPVKLGSWV